MKRFLASLTLTLILAHAIQAQTTDTTGLPAKKPNPSKQAARQLKSLQQQLSLTDDQVLQLQVILIQRDVALDSVKNNASPDRRSDNHARRTINQDADKKINAILTADQKPLYQQWKVEHAHRRQAQIPAQ